MFLDETPGDPTKTTVDAVLAKQATHLRDEPYVIYGPEDREVTYGEMYETANRIGNSLRQRGVEKGDRVSVLVDHSLVTLFTFYGLQTCGAVHSPVNSDLTGQALAYQLDDTAPSLLVLQDDYAGELNAIRSDLETVPDVVVYETSGESEPLADDFTTVSFDSLLDGDASPPDVDSHWSDEAAVLYTSGTTGDPKGVVHQHRYVMTYSENVWRIGAASGSVADEEYDYVHHTSLPLYHIAGLYADTFGPMVAGGTVVVWEKFSSSAFWDRIDRYGATYASLFGTMQSWLLNQPEREDDRHHTLDKVAPVPLLESAVDMAERFGFDFVVTGYGSTETGALTHGVIHAAKGEHATPPTVRRSRDPAEVRRHVEETGIPVVDEHPGQGWMGSNWRPETLDLAILDDHDQRVDVGKVGQLAVRPNEPDVIFRAYDGKPDETVEAWRNLWYHTGDAVRRDENGHYYFVDRMGSVIRRRGENISSGQVQEIVNAAEGVDRSAAFPVPAQDAPEDEVAVAVQPADGASLDESTLREHFEREMPAFMRPTYVMVTDDIPTTPTNKMEKYKLRERLYDRESLEK